MKFSAVQMRTLRCLLSDIESMEVRMAAVHESLPEHAKEDRAFLDAWGSLVDARDSLQQIVRPARAGKKVA